jgi:DNA primase
VLFGKNHFSGQENLLLAESELDVILAWQKGKHIFDLASLGGAGKHLSAQWMAYLLPYRKVILAYDADKAGRKGAKNLKLLSKRLKVSTPPAEDLCAFYQEGGNLQEWLLGLSR